MSSPILTPLATFSFTQANVNPLPSPWVAASGNPGSPLQIVSNTCQPSNLNASNEGYYTGTTIPNDQYAQFTIAALSGTTADFDYVGCTIRASGVTFEQAYALQIYGPDDGPFDWTAILYADGSSLFHLTTTFNVGDVIALAFVGTTYYLFQNGTVIKSGTDATRSSGETGLVLSTEDATADSAVTAFATGSASLAIYSISGNAGAAAATVAYAGTASGSVTADGSGNYTISSLANGSYTLTPSLATRVFVPASQNVTVSSANVTGVNFIDGYAPGAQPMQAFSENGLYCVIDNGLGLADGINFGCTENGAEFSNNGSNTFANESCPDFVVKQRTVCAAPIVAFLNPS